MFWALVLGDPFYILVIIGFVICMFASINVNSKFRKYDKIKSARGITGRAAAEQILRQAGINDVRIERVNGNLSDHYDPKAKVLRLSDSTYDSTSVAAIGVAAHECGHAIQHQVGYAPLKLRSLAVPMAQLGSWISFPLIIVGIIFSMANLAYLGCALFAAVVIFQLITLPVEFNASRRAVEILDGSAILYGEELNGAKIVLRAAALTYVAALLSSILQLLRFVLLVNRRN